MWYGRGSKADISGERAPHSFQSMTQEFWLYYLNLLLRLLRSSTRALNLEHLVFRSRVPIYSSPAL